MGLSCEVVLGLPGGALGVSRVVVLWLLVSVLVRSWRCFGALLCGCLGVAWWCVVALLCGCPGAAWAASELYWAAVLGLSGELSLTSGGGAVLLLSGGGLVPFCVHIHVH